MAKVAILLPDADIMSLALKAAKTYGLELSSMSIINRNNIRSVARAAAESGADIIIARGGQATDIHRDLPIPVVDIKITTFEVGMMIRKARLLCDKPVPQIALTGPRNMFVAINPATFEEVYEINLRLYLFDEPEEMDAVAKSAMADGADVVIGGSFIYQCCLQAGVPAMRTFSGEESVLEACRAAAMLGEALDQEKQHAASLTMLLDRVSSGVVQVDGQGAILRVNQFVEHLLSAESGSLEGLPVWRILPGISESLMQMVLKRHRDVHSASVIINHSEYMVSISPVVVEGHAAGAIISFHEMQPLSTDDKAAGAELIARGYRAIHTFDSLIARSPAMAQVAARARHSAAFFFPLLLTGPMGTEKQLIAECVHNAGPFAKKPFISYDCGERTPCQIARLLFADDMPGSAGEGQDPAFDTSCTLYLHEVALLSQADQYALLMLLQKNDRGGDGSGGGPRHSIRIIASTSRDLRPLVKTGAFRGDLYYALSVICLHVPPFSQRPEDVVGWVDYHVNRLQKSCGRYIKFTADAQKFLTSYSWPGNLSELKNVCQRIFVNCQTYYIDAAGIERQLDDPLCQDGADVPSKPSPAALPSGQGQAMRIVEVLDLYGGNRAAAAKALGISTTTLWRQMKKYRIPKNEGKPAASPHDEQFSHSSTSSDLDRT